MKSDLIVDELVPNIYYVFGRKKDDGYDTNSFHEILYPNKGFDNKDKRSFLNNPYLLLITNCDMIGCHIPPYPSEVLLQVGGFGKIENLNCFQDKPEYIKVLKEVKLSNKLYNYKDLVLKLNILVNLYIAKYIIKSNKYKDMKFNKNFNFYRDIINGCKEIEFSFLHFNIHDNDFNKNSLLNEEIIDEIVPVQVVNKIFKKVFEEFEVNIVGI